MLKTEPKQTKPKHFYREYLGSNATQILNIFI